MSKKGWDLHMHSTSSDGSYTPKELLDAAKEAGLKGISITDHDTVAAYDEDLYSYASQIGVELITGVEFSTIYEQLPVHILGYNIDVKNQSLKKLCLAHATRREDRNKKILKKLEEYGVLITYDELLAQGGNTIGRPHIAHLLMEKGVVSSIKEAFEKWIGDGKKCYERGKIFSPKEAIDTIRLAGGVAILAHPILYKKKSTIKGLLNRFDFDGMECYYAAFSEDQKYRIVKIANEHSLLVTGGSDFHGDTKPYIKIGASYTNEEDLERLLAHE